MLAFKKCIKKEKVIEKVSCKNAKNNLLIQQTVTYQRK